jgi:hypothetical protein
MDQERTGRAAFERCGLLCREIEVWQFEGDAATWCNRTRTTRLAHVGVGRRIFEEEIATASQRPSETQDLEHAPEHVGASAATAPNVGAESRHVAGTASSASASVRVATAIGLLLTFTE